MGREPDAQQEVITVGCAFCHQPVPADEAMPIQVENVDGTQTVAVFHKPPRACALEWAVAALADTAARMRDALDKFKRGK